VNNASLELDNARKILKTYRQVNDTPNNKPKKVIHSSLQKRNKELQEELSSIRAKFNQLEIEFQRREERLARLNRQLIDKTSDIARLQEDFENVIYQLTSAPLSRE